MDFAEKFQLGSKRLRNWDYSRDGFYFITICTHDRENIFGEIRNAKMALNEFGEIVEKFWRDSPAHFSNTKLDAFVVMPNHLHGIIVIDNFSKFGIAETCDVADVGTCGKNVETPRIKNMVIPRINNVETPRIKNMVMPRINNVETPQWGVSTNPNTKRNPNHKPEWKPGTIGVIINQFKSICTKRIRQIDPALDRVWQSRFYDHIIRDEAALNRIRNYIRQNPQNWGKDRENIKNGS